MINSEMLPTDAVRRVFVKYKIAYLIVASEDPAEERVKWFPGGSQNEPHFPKTNEGRSLTVARGNVFIRSFIIADSKAVIMR